MAGANIDRGINYVEFYGARLRNFNDKGDQLVGDCPFHDDSGQHLYINAKTGQYYCFVCQEKGNAQTFLEKSESISSEEAYSKLLKIAGIEQKLPKNPAKKPKKDYLHEYSASKKLPLDFLKALGVKNANIGVTIPYLDETGKIIATKKRRVSQSLKGPRFTWNKGAKLLPYGLWQLKELHEAGYCIFVEGESDSQTLWLQGFHSLGIPGANTFRNEWVDYIRDVPKVYIHQEPGEGGETFLRHVCGMLLDEGYRGKAYVIHTPGAKDPSDLHIANPDKFKEVWQLTLDNAKELDLAEYEPHPEQIIPDAPIRLHQPNGWLINDKGVHQETKDGLISVCATPLLITKRLRSIDTGSEKIELWFRRDNQNHKIRSQRSTVFQRTSLVQLADRGLPVTSENSKLIVRYLGALEAENMKLIPVARSTEQMGWIGSNSFLPGVEGDIVLDVEDGSAYIAAAYHSEGSFDEWKAAAQRAKELSPVARFVLAASLAAPLLWILNHRIFVVHCWGPSRGGKTALLKLALSVWGNPDGLIANFNTTRVGLERMAAFFNDLPLGIDEKQVTGDRQGFIESLVYLLGLGKGKARGARGGGLQQFKTWRTVALTTGEEPISTSSTSTGVTTRALEIWGQPVPDEDFAAALHDITGDNYGFAGVEFVRKVISLNNQDPDKIKTTFKGLASYFKLHSHESLGSHITAAAVVATADALASQWIFGEDEASAQSMAKEMGLDVLGRLVTNESANYAEKARGWLDSWIAQHKENFRDDSYGDKERVRVRYGWIKPDGYAILPSALEPDLQKAGFNPNRIYADFKDCGWILPDNDGTHVKRKVSIEGQKIRVIYYLTDYEEDEEPF